LITWEHFAVFLGLYHVVYAVLIPTNKVLSHREYYSLRSLRGSNWSHLEIRQISPCGRSWFDQSQSVCPDLYAFTNEKCRLSEKLQQVDIKITVVEVPAQVCMTKDNVNVHITSVIYYHIVNPYKATFGIGSVRTALIERTQTTLRHVLGARVLQDVIERREEVAQSIEEIIAEVATTWGVKVESILIKDINFSRELQDSLSMAAQSKRIGESKVQPPLGLY
jgi:SPFH domain / Band 7 family